MKKINLFSKLWSLSRADRVRTLAIDAVSLPSFCRVNMLKLVSVLVILLTVGVSNVWGVTATFTNSSNGSACTVNGTSGMKVGTNSKGGAFTITVPANATKLTLRAAAWNGVSGLSLNITPTTKVSPTSLSLTANTGIANNTPFTLSTGSNEADYQFDITLSSITTSTILTFTTSSKKRCAAWGAKYVFNPTDLTNGTITSNSAQVSWSYTNSTEYYEIYYSTNKSAPSASATPTISSATIGTTKSANITGLSAGTTYYWWVRSVDDYCKSAWIAGSSFTTAGGSTPTISQTSSFTTFTYTNGSPVAQSFTVSGSNLTDNLVVTAPSNYEVCKTQNGTYTSSVSFTPSTGTVSNETVYVRLQEGLNPNNYNWTGNSGIHLTSTGATGVYVNVSGNVPITIRWEANESLQYTTYVNYGGDNPGANVNTVPDDPEYDCGGKEFIGWCDGTYSHATDAPTLVTATTKVTSNKTYNAVFATRESGGSTATVTFSSAGDNGTSDVNTNIANYVSSASGMSSYSGSKVYVGTYGMKLATGSAAGTLTATLSSGISTTTITVDAKVYGSDNTSLTVTVNGGTAFGSAQTPSSSGGVLTFTAGSAVTVNSVTISTPSGKRAYVKTITVGGATYSNYSTTCCTDAAVVTLTPDASTIYRDLDGNASTTIGFSQTGGGSGSWGTPTVSPSGPTVTKDGANINFSATATGTYTVGIGYTETCEKTGSTDITVAEQGIISASGTASFSATCGVNSSSSDFTVNSRYLAGSTITASISTTTGSGNFTISTDNSTFNTSNTSITGGTSSKVISHIYVRYEPAADETGSIAGRLTLTQGGTTTYVDLSGTVTCGCSIRFTSDANLVRVTAANGIWVQANSELALSGSFLKTNDDDANVSIRAYTNNAHFQLKTSGTTGEGAAKTSRGDALILETNNSSNTANGWTGSIGIVYKPEAHNTTETATLTVEVYRYGGSTVYATTTYTLYGRSLPENFVIAVTNGSGSWFAIPADMVSPWGGSCSSGLGTYTPYPIEVNNTTTPTALTSNPPSRAIYTAAARTGAVNTNPQTLSFKSVTLAGSGNYYLYGSSGAVHTIQDADNATSEQQKWFLDVVNWSNKEYNMHISTDLSTQVLAYSTAGGTNSVGVYAANAATTKKSVYILPVTSTCTYYLAPTNITCQDIDDDYYYFRFKPDRTTNYEVSLDGSSWNDLTTTIADECTDDEHPTLLEGKVALATYRGQTVHIRVKSAGGCQSSTTFSVPNPNIAVNSGTWLSMTGIAGYAFSNTANSVTISGLASCGSQVVGVTCSNGDISASVNQSTGVVTISMTAGNATAGVHTGTLTFTLTGGTTRTQNIQITLQALAIQSFAANPSYFSGDMLCDNAGTLSSADVFPFALAEQVYTSSGTLATIGEFNSTDTKVYDLTTGAALTGSVTRGYNSAGTHIRFALNVQYSQFVPGHKYRIEWTNTGQVMRNSSNVPYADCYYDFIFSKDCTKPTALEACPITKNSFTANWTGSCANSTSTLEVYTKASTTQADIDFTAAGTTLADRSHAADNKWVSSYNGGVNSKNSDYGFPLNYTSDNYTSCLYSPLLSNWISSLTTSSVFTVEVELWNGHTTNQLEIDVSVVSAIANSNTYPTNKSIYIDGISATSKKLTVSTDDANKSMKFTFTISGAAASDRLYFKPKQSSKSSQYLCSVKISTDSKNVILSQTVTCSDGSYNVSSGLSSNTTYFYTVTNNGNTSNEMEVKTRTGNPLIIFRDAGENTITSLDMSTEVGIPTSETVEVYATRTTICDLEDMITSLTGTYAGYFTVTADFSTWTFYPQIGTYYGDITITYQPMTAGGHTATYSITDNATTSSLTLNGTATGGQIELVHWASTGISVESYVIASGTPRVGSYTGVLQSDGTYQISDAGWAVGDQANEVITVVWGATSESFRVPILVASNKNSSTLSSVTSESDIVVGQGHTLTINNTLTCHGLEIYPGAKVQFSGGSLTAKYIRLYNNGDTWSTFAIFDASGASSIAVDNVYADFRIDEDRYHYITLPFDIMTGNVVYAAPAANGPNPPALRNSANNTAFYVRQYDGRTRETNNLATETTYNVNMPHIGTKGGSYSMTAGRGYMIAIGDQLSATGHKKRTLRFPIAMNSTKWTAEQASSKVVGGAWVADGTDNASARATNKGWNLVGNPFMRELTVTSTSGGLATGVLETPGEDSYIWKINDNGVRYITIYNAATDAFTYQPLNVSFTLKPMAAFYVQMKNAKYINFQAALTGQAAMPAIMRAPLEEEEAVNVMVKLSVADKSDKTGVVLHSKYDAAYNEDDDADYPKLMSGTQVALWSIAGEEQLANNGLPKTSASNIPLGYQAPQTGTYTISLDIDESTLSSLKHVWLTDNDGGTPRDLMLESYTFEVSGTQLRSDRFFLSIELQPKEEILTGTDDAMSESEKPYKFIYQDKLYIMRGGVIYDATGKRVMEINK